MNGEDPDLEPLPLNTGFLLILGLAAPLMHLVCFLFLSSTGLPQGITTAGMATIITYGALFAVCAPRLPEPTAQMLGFARAPRVVWMAVPFLLWSIVLTSEADNIIRSIYPMPEVIDDGSSRVDPPLHGFSMLIVQLVVFPIAYELFFRGVMQPVLVGDLGARSGLLLTATVCGFAVSMGLLNPWAILPSILTALVYGILRHASGSIFPGLVLHAFGGLLGLMAYYRMLGIPGFDDTTVAHTPLGWLLVAALFTGIGLRLCRLGSPLPATEPELPED